MGTGVGEAALAAEAIGAAEAAGAVGGGAGFLEGMAGVSALEGAGVAGLGLGTGAGLGAGLAGAGGLGALSPAFQTALGETAVFNPEIAAQVAQFADIGAVPSVNAALGAGQIGDPALLAQQFGSGIQNVTPGVFNELGAVETADLMKNIDPRLMQGYMPMDTPNAANMAEKARFADYWAKYPTAFDSSTLATAGQGAGDISAIAGNADKAALLSDAGYGTMASPAELSAARSGFDFTSPFKSIYDVYEKQDPLTKGIMKYGGLGLGALQAAKYLNKTPGVAPAEKYNGPLSKFTYDPSTYRPYAYRPYAAGGPVEEMSRENAIGANTGYPQANIQQGAYATPWQTPVSRNVVAGAGDVGVDQMTGMERMARGGAVRYAAGGMYSDPYTNQYADPNSLMASGDSLYSNEGKGQSPGTSASGPGQGISNSAIGLGLGLMGLAESVPGLATGLAGLIGQSIADNQADAIGGSFSALSSIADTPGVTAVSDASGNVTGISTAEGIAAADAAAGLTGDSGDSGGDSGGDGGGGGGDGGGGFADGGKTEVNQNDPYGLLSLLYNPQMYGMTGAAMSAPAMASPSMYSPMMYNPSAMSSSLVDPAAEYAAAQPVMSMPQQNFQDFLAQYQNLPGMSKQEIADWSTAKKAADAAAQAAAAPPASGYNYDTGVPVGLGSNEAAYDSAAGSPGGGAKAGGLMHHMAMGGLSNLGGYSDGGRLLKGPGDGMSDNIPATIGRKQPARLADGEFVIPADVVSGLGNGSTDAGAKQLYKMLDKVRAARTGNKKQGRQIKADKYMPV
jgi:hypothetical protein